jgi:hypothetical protein
MPNQLVDFVRKNNPLGWNPEDMSALKDDDITRLYAAQAPEYSAQGRDVFKEYPDFAADWDRIQKEDRIANTSTWQEFKGSLGAGIDQTQALAYGAGGMVAQKLGATNIAKTLIGKAAEQQQEAADYYQPAVANWRDVSGPRTAMLYAANQFGNLVPSIGESVVAAGAGAAIGAATGAGVGGIPGAAAGLFERGALKALVKAKVSAELKGEIEKYAAGTILKDALSAPAKELLRAATVRQAATVGQMIGNLTGGAAASMQQNSGELFMELQDQVNKGELSQDDAANIALVGGGIKAVPDTVLPTYIVGRLGKAMGRAGRELTDAAVEPLKKPFYAYVTRLAPEVAKTVPWEGSTEAFQSLVDVAGQRYGAFLHDHDEGKLWAPLNQAEKDDIINSGIAGTMGGGATSAVTELFTGKKRGEQQPPPKKEATNEPPPPPDALKTGTIGSDVAKDIYDVDRAGIALLVQRKAAGDPAVELEILKLNSDSKAIFNQEWTRILQARSDELGKSLSNEKGGETPNGEEANAQGQGTQELQVAPPVTETSTPAPASVPSETGAGGVSATAEAERPAVSKVPLYQFAKDLVQSVPEDQRSPEVRDVAELLNKDTLTRADLQQMAAKLGLRYDPKTEASIPDVVKQRNVNQQLTWAESRKLGVPLTPRILEAKDDTGKVLFRSVVTPQKDGGNKLELFVKAGATFVPVDTQMIPAGTPVEAHLMVYAEAMRDPTVTRNAEVAQSPSPVVPAAPAALATKEAPPPSEAQQASPPETPKAAVAALKTYFKTQAPRPADMAARIQRLSQSRQPRPAEMAAKIQARSQSAPTKESNAPIPQHLATEVRILNAPTVGQAVGQGNTVVQQAPVQGEVKGQAPVVGKEVRKVEEALKPEALGFAANVVAKVDALGENYDGKKNLEYLKTDLAAQQAELKQVESLIAELKKADKDAEALVDRHADLILSISKLERAIANFKAEEQSIVQAIGPAAVEFEYGSLDAAKPSEDPSQRGHGDSLVDDSGSTAVENAFGRVEDPTSGDEPGMTPDESSDAQATLDSEEAARKIAKLPGYYDTKDDTGGGHDLSEAHKLYNEAKTQGEKEYAAKLIGTLLTAQSQVGTAKRSEKGKQVAVGKQSSSLSRRVAGWITPAGRVILSLAYNRNRAITYTLEEAAAGFGITKKEAAKALKSSPKTVTLTELGKALKKTKGDVNAVSKKLRANKVIANLQFRFAIGDGAKDTVGVIDLLEAGFVPYSSMLLRSPRNQLARAIRSVADYEGEFGGLKQARDDAYGYSTDNVRTASGDIVNARNFTPEQALNRKEQLRFADWVKNNMPMVAQIVAFQKDHVVTSPELIQQFAKELQASVAASYDSIEDRAMIQRMLDETLPTIITNWNGVRKALSNENTNAGSSSAIAEGATGNSQRDNAADGGIVAGVGQGTPPAAAQPAQAPSETGTSARLEPSPTSVATLDAMSEKMRALVPLKAEAVGVILSLHEDGGLSDGQRDQILDMITKARTPHGIETALDVAQEAVTPSRERQLDPDAMDAVDLDAQTITAPELLPDSVENVIFNLKRLAKSKLPATQHGLLSEMNIAALKKDYPTLAAALEKVAEAGGELAALAKFLAGRADVTEAKLTISPETQVGTPLGGSYSVANNEATVFPANARNVEDFHVSVVHEALHPFISRLLLRARNNPASLTVGEQEFVQKLHTLVEAAKAAGLTWQQSAEGLVGSDEFAVAVLSDPEFRDKLTKIALPPNFGDPTSLSLWDAFKRLVANLLKAVGLTSDKNVADEAYKLVTTLLQNYDEAAAARDKAWRVLRPNTGPMNADEMRYRQIKGLAGERTEISPTREYENEAKRMMAVTNEVAAARSKYFDALVKSGNNVTTTGKPVATEAEWIQNSFASLIQGGEDPAEDIKAAINSALTKDGTTGKPVSTSLTFADLEQTNEAPKAQMAALEIHYKDRTRWQARKALSDHEFGEGKLTERISESNLELYELTQNYQNLDVVTGQFLKSMKDALREATGTGAQSILEALGIKTGFKEALRIAAGAIEGNKIAFGDQLQALAELGIDYSTVGNVSLTSAGKVSLTPGDVQAAAAASANPNARNIAADPARLALALQFARRRPIAMDLLAVRTAYDDKGVQKTAINQMIKLAVSNKPDARALAVGQLSRVGTLFVHADRILKRLDTIKAENEKLLKQAAQLSQWDVEWHIISKIQAEEIRKLERMRDLEEGTFGEQSRQFKWVNNAVYLVPESNLTTEDDLFTKPEFRQTVQHGDNYSDANIQQNLTKIVSWMAEHPGSQGSGRFAFLERVVREAAGRQANSANENIQRGLGGWILRSMGDIGTRFRQHGTQTARAIEQQIVTHNNREQSLRNSINERLYYKVDELARAAMIATGIDNPVEFHANFYHNILGLFQSEQHLYDPRLTPEQQLDQFMATGKRFVQALPGMERKGAWEAVDKYIRANFAAAMDLQNVRRGIKLKIRDVMVGGRVIFRDVIGGVMSTMSRYTAGPAVALAMRMKGSEKLFWNTPWMGAETDDAGNPTPVEHVGLTKSAVALLHSKDRAALQAVLDARFTAPVNTTFVAELISKPGQTNFKGPEVGGVVDMAPHAQLRGAYQAATAGRADGTFDALKFAETLHADLGGSPDTLSDFVGQTMATFQHYMDELYKVAKVDEGDQGNDLRTIGRAFLDARKGEDFPPGWLNFRTYGHKDYANYIRVLAEQDAYGAGATDLKANLAKLQTELTLLADDFKAAEAIKTSNPALSKDYMENGLNGDRPGLRKMRENAVYNLEYAQKNEDVLFSLIRTHSGGGQSYQTLMDMVGVMSGFVLQGVTSAVSDHISLPDHAFRKFGFSKEAVSVLFGGYYKNYAFELMHSMWQAMSWEMRMNAENAKNTRLLNSGGAADLDSLTERRGWRSMLDRYRQQLGAEASLWAVAWRSTASPLRVPGEVVRAVTKRVNAAARVFLSTGVGKPKNVETAAATLKWWAPFSMNNIIMQRAAARTWLEFTNDGINKAALYFQYHPADAADPNFKFSAKTANFSRKNLSGLMLDDRAFKYFYTTLEKNGIQLEDAARKRLSGAEPLTFDQIRSVIALANTEVLLNTGITTRAPWTLNNTFGRIVSPLTGWALIKTADVVKSSREPEGRASLRAAASAATAFTLAIVPVTIAYAVMRKEYEKDIVGKAPNQLPFKLDENLPLALLDSFSRLGTFGIISEPVNSIFNVSTAREFSVDSRVFVASTIMNLGAVLTKLARQGPSNSTYASTWRQFIQAAGGTGYLQNFDAINNMLDLDNTERRIVERINVGNLIRVAGREQGLDLRIFRGSAAGMINAIPNPVKPWVGNMVLAAYVNDPAAFREAYSKALEVASLKAVTDPEVDPYADVAEAYERMNPLRSTFNKSPSAGEYQKMLASLGDSATEVSAAIRNFNAYGAQVRKSRANTGGLTPFFGTERRAVNIYGSSSMSGGGGGARDYRSIAAGFGR